MRTLKTIALAVCGFAAIGAVQSTLQITITSTLLKGRLAYAIYDISLLAIGAAVLLIMQRISPR
jgi:hypothetical protein